MVGHAWPTAGDRRGTEDTGWIVVGQLQENEGTGGPAAGDPAGTSRVPAGTYRGTSREIPGNQVHQYAPAGKYQAIKGTSRQIPGNQGQTEQLLSMPLPISCHLLLNQYLSNNHFHVVAVTPSVQLKKHLTVQNTAILKQLIVPLCRFTYVTDPPLLSPQRHSTADIGLQSKVP